MKKFILALLVVLSISCASNKPTTQEINNRKAERLRIQQSYDPAFEHLYNRKYKKNKKAKFQNNAVPIGVVILVSVFVGGLAYVLLVRE